MEGSQGEEAPRWENGIKIGMSFICVHTHTLHRYLKTAVCCKHYAAYGKYM